MIDRAPGTRARSRPSGRLDRTTAKFRSPNDPEAHAGPENRRGPRRAPGPSRRRPGRRRRRISDDLRLHEQTGVARRETQLQPPLRTQPKILHRAHRTTKSPSPWRPRDWNARAICTQKGSSARLSSIKAFGGTRLSRHARAPKNPKTPQPARSTTHTPSHWQPSEWNGRGKCMKKDTSARLSSRATFGRSSFSRHASTPISPRQQSGLNGPGRCSKKAMSPNASTTLAILKHYEPSRLACWKCARLAQASRRQSPTSY